MKRFKLYDFPDIGQVLVCRTPETDREPRLDLVHCRVDGKNYTHREVFEYEYQVAQAFDRMDEERARAVALLVFEAGRLAREGVEDD